jgi:hypothetical protein
VSTKKTRPCMMDDCPYPALAQKRKCEWHWLLRQAPDIQIDAAKGRRVMFELSGGSDPVARVPKAQWPEGERWCSDCQGFVPLFYASGSKCRAHTSLAAHGGRLEKVYGITTAEYDALMGLQGGLCFICRRAPTSKRLAVDHDHKTGLVRGLLCPDNERGCNHAVIGNLEAHSQDGLLAALRRAIDYIEHPPYERLRGVHHDHDAAVPSEAGENLHGDLRSSEVGVDGVRADHTETLEERWAREAESW